MTVGNIAPLGKSSYCLVLLVLNHPVSVGTSDALPSGNATITSSDADVNCCTYEVIRKAARAAHYPVLLSGCLLDLQPADLTNMMREDTFTFGF
jgi:hypothetical protein